jgi:hypothetical protein
MKRNITPVNVQLYYSDSDSSYMFRLRKAAIIRMRISEVRKGELCTCSLTYSCKMLMDATLALCKVYMHVLHRKYLQ